MRHIKKRSVVVVAAVALLTLTACDMEFVFEEDTLIYEKQERPVSEIESIISNSLEVENPTLDVEVSILKEPDDD